jgi:hypothetical protein
MIKKYAYCVLHEGLPRQLEFNRRFMDGLVKCIEAIDKVSNLDDFMQEVHKIASDISEVDAVCASALLDYIETILATNSENTDFERVV